MTARRARQASRQPHRGREGRGSQEGYVQAQAAEPAEDFRNTRLRSLASNGLMGGLRRRREQCYRQLAVKGQCRRGFDPPEVWTASPGRLVCLAVFGTGEVEWGSLPHTPRPTNPRVTITHPSCEYKKNPGKQTYPLCPSCI